MANNEIQVQPDSTGQKVQTFVNLISGQNVNAQAIVIVDATGVPITTLPVSIAGSVAVTGTFFQSVQPVSATSLPLPTGAATSAKQPALGVAGTASTDIITVQGIASMTALKVDGSAVTQPVSGTVAATQSGSWAVTANAGTNLNTSLLALDSTLTGGSLKAQIWDGSNVIGTSAHPVRVDPTGTTTQPVSGSVSVSNFPATQPVSGTVTANQGGSWTVTANAGTNLNTSSLALDATVSTMSGKLPAALVGARLDTNTGSWLGSTAPTVGSKTSANSVPVVIASDQGAVAVSGTVTTTPPANASTNIAQVAGAAVATGHGTAAGALRVELPTDGTGVVGLVAGTAVIGHVIVDSGAINVSGAAGALALDATVSTMSAKLPAALVGARLDVNAGSWMGSTAPTVGSKTSANSLPIVIASDQATFPVTVTFPATQPISAVSLPLPTGAALEAGGNLAAIAASDSTQATALTQIAAGNGNLQNLADILTQLLADHKRTNVLLKMLIAATGNLIPSDNDVDNTTEY